MEATTTEFSKICLLIPAYQPDAILIELVEKLLSYTYQQIIIINDGSDPDKASIFNALKAKPNVQIIHLEKNSGKGAAIKTGMHFVLNNYPDSIGVVTADADGQHLVEDIAKIAKALYNNPNAMILGCRELSKAVPFRSLFGNNLTSWLFDKLYKTKILDTQTGLRGISATLLPDLVNIKYSGYEYEMACLIFAVKKKHPILQVSISAIYINHNIASHFKPVMDSIKIYTIFFRYAFK